MAEIKPGEILVAPATSTAWTVAFSITKGLVTDSPGTLSNPVIMACKDDTPREAGCLEATGKNETDQRVRLDGDRGVVYILDKPTP